MIIRSESGGENIDKFLEHLIQVTCVSICIYKYICLFHDTFVPRLSNLVVHIKNR